MLTCFYINSHLLRYLFGSFFMITLVVPVYGLHAHISLSMKCFGISYMGKHIKINQVFILCNRIPGQGLFKIS